MDLYNIKGTKLEGITVDPFKLEKDIQSIVENNTETLFNVEFVSTEFSIGNYRLDSLCFDHETNSFVIIEYKKGSSYSVIDQGYSYLSIMLNNKSDFILEYNEKTNKNLKRSEVDWSQSKIIFVSPSFNSYQKNSVNFKDVPFELWEISKYSNNTVSLNQIITKSKESINKLSTNTNKTSIIQKVSKEIKVYDESDFMGYIGKELEQPYTKLRDKLLEWDNVSLKFKNNYIGVWKNKSVVVYINKGKKYLSIELVRSVSWKGLFPKGKEFILDDPKKLFKLFEDKYRRQYYYHLKDIKDLDYITMMIKQKYEDMK